MTPTGTDGAERAVVAGLRSRFATGRTRGLAWRLAQLDGLDRLLSLEATALVDAVVADLGRGRTEVYLTEVAGVQRELAVLRRGLRRWAREEAVPTPLVLRPGRSWIRREPLGVVCVIGPWNYPVNLLLAPLAAAVSAGNCAVLKPSEEAPASSGLLARLLPQYLDPEAVAVCEGGPETTEALIDAGVDHVFFTGSPAVGRLVAARAAHGLVPVTLELGGKSPVVVDRTVDVSRAAFRIAWGKLLNAGQSCIAPDYVLVEDACKEALVEALSAAVARLYGPDPAQSRDYGRIVNDRHLRRLAGLLTDHGGDVVLGGVVDAATRYVAPTVVLEPRADAPLMTEEIFGPILPVVGVADLEAAAAAIGARPDPLALYVFSEDRAAVDRLLASTRSGSACWNTTMHHFASSHLPFGGVGRSGTGAYHGRHGYERLSQLRPVLHKPLRPELPFAYPPYHPWKARLLTKALSLPGRVRAGAVRARKGTAGRRAGEPTSE